MSEATLDIDLREGLETTDERLFSIFDTHLKSHYVPWNEDRSQGAADADARRLRQAESRSATSCARTSTRTDDS